MLFMPEAKLAKEAEICYTSLSMVTDFDWQSCLLRCQILETLTNNSSKAQRIITLPEFLSNKDLCFSIMHLQCYKCTRKKRSKSTENIRCSFTKKENK